MAITAVRNTAFRPGALGDVDGDGFVDIGDVLRHTLVVTNTGPGAVTGVTINDALNGSTPYGTVNVSPLALDETYTAISNTLLEVGNATTQTRPQSNVAGSVLSNDIQFDDVFHISAVGATAVVGGAPVSITTANGGTVTMITSGADAGSFTYMSATGFVGNDSFTYTITDNGLDGAPGGGDDLSSTATVTIQMTSQVWYVDNSFVGVSNGTSTNPYTSLAAVTGAAGGDGTGDIIYLHTGTADYTGGITLLNNQTLHGAGSALVVDGFTLAAAGVDPTIVNAAGSGVTLASGNTLTGFTVGDTTGFDIQNTNTASVGNLTVSNVVLNGTGGLFRADSGGTLNVQLDSATTSAAGASGIVLTNVDNSTFTVSGATTINDATTNGITISNSQGSTFTFAGKVTVLNDAGGANASGVDLQTNNAPPSDSTFNFNGGVDITVNGTNAFGFRAQSSGVVNILNPNGDNQITSNNGTALFVNPTQFNAALTSVTAGGGSGDGIHLEGVSGTGVTIGTVSINGTAGDGVDITNSTAAIAINAGTIGNTNDPGGIGVDINGGSANVTINATIAKTTAGDIVEVTGRTGGTIDFNGGLTSSSAGGGIDMTGNSGGTVRFDGGMNLSTGANTAFNSTGNTGMTVVVTDTPTTANILATTSGTALNVANTTIGAEDLTFQSISANGASKGIILNTTGSSGGLHVTGVGTTDGSGGTIQNISVRGAELLSTADVVLNNMAFTNANTTNGSSFDLDISNSNAAIYMSAVTGASLTNVDISGTTADNGITGLNVSNFVMNNSTINNAGNAANESGIEFNNLSGTSSISNSTINFSATNSLDVVNTNQNLNLTLNNVQFSDTQFNTAGEGGAANSLGEGGFQFRNFGNGTANIDVLDSDFWNLRTQAIQVIGQGTSVTNVDIVNNNIDALHGFVGSPVAGGPNIGTGIDINGNDNAQVNYNVNNNPLIQSSSGIAVNVTSFLGSQVMGRVNNNTVSSYLIGDGIRAVAQETSHNTIEIKGNTVTVQPGSNSSAISGQARFQSARLDMTIDGNTTTVQETAVDDIDIIAGSSTANETNQVYVDFKNNHASGVAGGNNIVFRLRVSDLDGTSDPRIFLHNFVEGGAGIEDDAIATWNGHANTPSTNTVNVNVSLTGSATGIQSGTVQTPTNPLPMFIDPVLPPPPDKGSGDGGDTGGADGTDNPPPAPPPPPPPVDTGAPAGPVVVDDGVLSQAELTLITEAAIARWAAAGASIEQLAAMRAVTVTVEDLPGLNVGLSDTGRIRVDTNAAGFSWFVDATPGDDSEYVGDGTLLAAAAHTQAGDRVDLLTTIMHELGHQIGLDDTYTTSEQAELMYGYAGIGQRRLPGADDARLGAGEAVVESPLAISPVLIGNLPANKSVTIQWDSQVDPWAAGLAPTFTNKSVVTGSFGSVDSNTQTLSTASALALDSLTLGGTVWNDNGAGGGGVGNGALDGAEPGVVGVALSLFVDNDNNDIPDTPGTSVATTTTGAGGTYSFTGLAPGNYIVRVDLSNFTGGVLTALQVSPTTSPEPADPDDNVDNDDSGSRAPGTAAFSKAITLSFNSEPQLDGSGRNDVNNTLDFGFAQANQAPVNTVPGAQAINEDATLTFTGGTAISISDADAAAGNVTVTLSVAKGQLTLSGVAGLAFSVGDGTDDTTMTFSGTVASINTALGGLLYRPNGNFNGADTLTITTNDNGNTGADPGLTGGPSDEQDSDTVTINIAAINDAPVVAGDGTESATTINEDTPGAGETVFALFNGQYSDAADNQIPNGGASSPGAFGGIAVVANGSSGATGEWQYFNSNTSLWVDIGARSTATALLINSSTLIRFNPAANFNGAAPTLTAHLIDNSLGFGITFGQTANLTGATGATTAYSTGTVVLSQAVTAINDAPVNTVGGTVNTVEDAVGVVLSTTGSAMSVSDVEATGTIVYSLSVSHGTLTILENAPGGITAANIQVLAGTGNGTAIINISATAAEINATLAAANGLTYTPDANFNGTDTLEVYVNDGGQTGLDTNGASLLGAATGAASEEDYDTRTINVAAVPDTPVAQPDAVTTAENLIGTGSLFDDNGSGVDVDVDAPRTISEVNGSALAVGQQITLASGAKLTVNADGSYSYDPSGKFDYLISSGTAIATNAVNTSALDGFTYRLAGGNTATVTMTVTGVLSTGDQLWGDSGNNAINGGAGAELFNLGQGGDDAASGGDGSDGFYFGAALDGADSVDGGAGADDQVGLQGSYGSFVPAPGSPFVFGANHLVDIETLVLLPGNDTRFGDTSGALYSYNIATIDANVGNGERLTVNFNTLRAGENVMFDGSDEHDGMFVTYGGLGNDTLIGGDQSDQFYFGNNGRWGAGDSVVGGLGADDQLGLQGSYAITFGAGQMSGIETLVLLTGGEIRYGNLVGIGYSYDLTMADGNVAGGATMVVNAGTLRAGVVGVTDETLTFDGSAETDGQFTIYSGLGDDVLIGSANDDRIYGAGGADTMTGGAGNDTFAYLDAAHSSATATDQILDFSLGDRIDLSAIDAIAGGSNDAFTFVGAAAFSNTAGELRVVDLGGGAWQIEADIDGIGGADLVIGLTAGHVLAATDFTL